MYKVTTKRCREKRPNKQCTIFGHFTKETYKWPTSTISGNMYNTGYLREIANENSHELPTSCPQRKLKMKRLTVPNVGKGGGVGGILIYYR